MEIFCRILYNLGMKDQVFTQKQIVQYLSPVFDKYNIKEAVLFGSYGKNMANDKSDVDIMVDSGLRGLTFVAFLEDVKEALGQKEVDLFDKKHIIPDSPIDQEIKKTGVKIYG